MKSRIFNLILFFVLFTFGAQAQVKGHDYYCWTGSLAKNIDCEIRMEHDNDHLALGEIIYYRKKGNTSSISLYGTIKQTGKGLNVELFEYLPSGKNTGIISITIQNGQPQFFTWSSPDSKTRYNFNLKETRAFPFDEVQTYFQPLKEGDDADGVYVSTNRFDASTSPFTRLELNRTGYAYFALNFVNPETENFHQMVAARTSPSRIYVPQDQNLQPTAMEVRLFRNFVYVYVIADPEKALSKIGPISNFYFRKPDEKIINWPAFHEDHFENITAARLVDGVVSIYNNPELVVESSYLQGDDIMASKGWVNLEKVTPGVKDIFVADIGQDTNPVLGILNQDGTVQILSLINSAPKGITWVSRPLPDQKDIVRFTFTAPDAEVDYSTFYGIDKEGKYHEIYIFTLDGDWEMDKVVREDGTPAGSWICISPEWKIDFHNDVNSDNGGYIHNYYGTIWPADENFETFEYHFTEQNDSRDKFQQMECDVKGTFKVETGYDPEEEVFFLNITPLTGLNFEVPKGQSGKFKKIHVVG